MKDLVKKQAIAEVAFETPVVETRTIESQIDSATKFKLKHGMSKTRAKLLKKYNCKTNAEYIEKKKKGTLTRV